jgi:DNA helicase-2/ATP-dependent DNA helicase PcrA
MDLSHLNDAQLQAVTAPDGPLLVIAGAGSGKTRVLTHRVAYLLEERNLRPSQLLAITFTNKAAGEMKERIAALVGPVTGSMWVGTFHATCVRILRRDADRIGYPSGFVIYDGQDQKTVIKQIVKERNIDDKQFPPRFFSAEISNAKNDMLTAADYRRLHDGDFEKKMVADVYEAYEKVLRKNGAMDFDDLLMKTIELFKAAPDVLAFYQQKFHHVLVDEYQDTNKAQYMIVKLISSGHGNVFVVGDMDQSIYRWRGADIRNIREFEKDFDSALIIKLEQNYRSTKRILRAANRVIEKNIDRREKKLWTEHVEGEKLGYYFGHSAEDEAAQVVETLLRLKKMEGYAYGDMAILYRTNAQSRAFEDLLRREGVAYQLIGGIKFYERKEIKDLVAYITLVLNPQDDLSTERVINEPKRGIGKKTLERVKAFGQEQGISLFEAFKSLTEAGEMSGRSEKSLRDFFNLYESLQAEMEYLSVMEIVERLLDKSGYLDALKNDRSVEAQTRVDNLMEFKAVVDAYEKTAEASDLEEFLTTLSLTSDVDQIEEEDRVTLMTVHSAKGLEYPVVFVVGLEEKMFPTFRALENESDLEEERRLFYVALTRAKERLFLSHAEQRFLYGRNQINQRSRFIEEVPVEEFETAPDRSEKPHLNDGPSFEAAPIRKKAANAGAGLSPGTKIRHKIFGIGTIISKQGDYLKVAFDDQGIKTLDPAYVTLEVL